MASRSAARDAIARAPPGIEGRVGLEDWVIADRDPSRARKDPPGRPRRVSARDRHRQHRHPERDREAEGAGLETLDSPGVGPFALRKDHDDVACLEQADGLARGRRIGRLDADGKCPQPPDHPAEQRDLEQPAPGHVVDAPADRERHERRIGVGLMIRGDDHGPADGNVGEALQLEAKVCAAQPVNAGTKEIDDRGPHGPSLHKKRGRNLLPAPLDSRS
jgi:hypothetical protein